MKSYAERRSQAIGDAEQAARRWSIAATCHYRREIEARRTGTDLAIIRAEIAKTATEDFAEILAWETLTLEHAGLAAEAGRIVRKAARAIEAAWKRLAAGEVEEGRIAPPLPIRTPNQTQHSARRLDGPSPN